VGPLLTILYQDEDNQVRQTAVEVLAKVGQPAVEPLIALLRQSYMPYEVITALKKIGPIAIPPLLGALRAENKAIRDRAAIVLYQIEPNWAKLAVTQEAIPAFEAALGDRDAGVREMATWVLNQIGSPKQMPSFAKESRPPLVRAKTLDDNLRDFWFLTRQSWPAALTLLATLLADKDKQARQSVVQALGQGGDSRAVEPLLRLLGDPDRDIRRAAGQALKQLDPAWRRSTAAEEVIPLLLASLKNGDRDTRRGAAWALKQLKDMRTVKPLVKALQDEQWHVRQAAAQALKQIDPNWQTSAAAEENVPGWGAALDDKKIAVQEAAVSALAQVGNAEAVGALFHALHNENTRGSAMARLVRRGDAALVKELVEVLVSRQGRRKEDAAPEIELLKRLLKRIAPAIAPEDLQTITQFDNLYTVEYGSTPYDWDFILIPVPLNCARVKKLAQQELARREKERKADP
jgi:HEAT repeat protein